MAKVEWSKIHHHPRLGVGFLHAYYVQHAYPRHSHDYFVISLIERGNQSFLHKGARYRTPPGGVILINPGAVHTGEPADRHGFELRSIYPSMEAMRMAVHELTGRRQGVPFFREVRVDHPWAKGVISSLHGTLSRDAGMLEGESHLIWTLAQLIGRYADVRYTERKIGREKAAVRKARVYIQENFQHGMSLSQLARYVSLSPYYFLRVFCAEVGMPPHAYLESVRISRAQRLIEEGRSLGAVAFESGFSSQSHLTNRFKKIIGVTPGRYAAQVRT